MAHSIRQSLEKYAEQKNTTLARMFIIAGLIVAGITWLYVLFIGRNQEEFFLRQIVALLLFLGGIIFIFVARAARDGFAAIAYAVLAVFMLFGAVVSLIVALILYGWVYP